MHLDDGRTLFVNLKKLTQHKAQLVDTQQSSSLNSVDHAQMDSSVPQTVETARNVASN